MHFRTPDYSHATAGGSAAKKYVVVSSCRTCQLMVSDMDEKLLAQFPVYSDNEGWSGIYLSFPIDSGDTVASRWDRNKPDSYLPGTVPR